jgi:hypothetical protein
MVIAKGRGRQGRAAAVMAMASGLALLAGPGPSLAQDSVQVQVFNRSGHALTVSILDLVCRQRLVDSSYLLDQASLLVSACPDADGEATIEVTGPLGSRQTFSGLVNPSTVDFEFP